MKTSVVRKLLRDIVKAAYESGEKKAVAYFANDCIVKPHIIENMIQLISGSNEKVTYEMGKGFFLYAFKGSIRVEGPNVMDYYITYLKIKDLIKNNTPMFIAKYLKHKPFKEVTND